MGNQGGGTRGEGVAGPARPPVKWAGGKGRLIPQLQPYFPAPFDHYVEPFVGGGAVFFHLAPDSAVLIDNNAELINFYQVVRDSLAGLVEDLRKHKNAAEYYYQMRSMDPARMDQVRRASRFLYLNRTGYNGLWRVNSQGRHNVPFGRYKNPTILDQENLSNVSSALRRAELVLGDFGLVLRFARPSAFVYMDPPYDPLSASANFTSYTAESFTEDDQRRLAEVFRELDRMGCTVMLSNSDTSLVRDLYSGYDIRVVQARRAINCRADRRGPIAELVIRNYGEVSRTGALP